MDAKKEEIIIGVDVSKDKFDVAVRPTGQKIVFANSEDGICMLMDFAKPLSPTLIVFEATGGLETLAVTQLAAKALPIVVVNPRHVRDFAKATGRLAKTDAIDADIIAWFGEALKPKIRALPNEEALKLDALNTRRRQIVDMIVAEKNRLTTAPAWTKESVRNHIAWLEKCIDKINKDMAKFIRKSPVWKGKDKILRSTPGVGPVLSVTMLSCLPEIGALNSKKISALVGVAPLNRDSGKIKGKRIIWGGRANIRPVLYMSTLAAIRCNPVIKNFYERLTKGGKPKKVAITACMHKLLVILNAMIKNNTLWDNATC